MIFRSILTFFTILCTFGSVAFGSNENYESLDLPEFIVGACTHLGMQRGDPESFLSMVKQANVGAIRDELFWSRCERVKGEYTMPSYYREAIDLAVDKGIMPLNILDYANRFYDDAGYPRSEEAVEGFARYSEFVVRELKGKVRLYQVWNEWDGGCGMRPQYHRKGDPEAYINLLQTVSPRIKKADPEAVVVGNSVCTGDAYLEKLLKLGLLNYCDVVALHTYNFGKGTGKNTPEAWHARMQNVDLMLKKYSGGKSVPLYVTEMGWPTYIASKGSTEEVEAINLSRLYLLARTLPYIKGIWWYDFMNDGWRCNEMEDNFGIVHTDLSPKPAFYVMRDIAPLVTNGKYLGRIDAGNSDIWILRFKFENRDVLAMWSVSEKNNYQLILKNSSEELAPVSIRNVGQQPIVQNWGYLDWKKHMGKAPDPTKLSVLLKGLPVIIEGNLDSVDMYKIIAHPFTENDISARCLKTRPEQAVIAGAVGEVSIPIEVGEMSNYHVLGNKQWGGRSDLDISFTANYTSDNLFLTVDVTDDVFCQKNPIEDAWLGDSLQMAFQTGKGGGKRTELDVGLTTDGARVYCRSSEKDGETGVLKNVKAVITQSEKVTRYQLTIPADVLGLKTFESRFMMGFSMLANDNDGLNRKGVLQWGRGIALSKDPSLYNLLIMK